MNSREDGQLRIVNNLYDQELKVSHFYAIYYGNYIDLVKII